MAEVHLGRRPRHFGNKLRYEAKKFISLEPLAGSQLYQGSLSHAYLMRAVSTIISHKIKTERIPVLALRNHFWNCSMPRTISPAFNATCKPSQHLVPASNMPWMHFSFTMVSRSHMLPPGAPPLEGQSHRPGVLHAKLCQPRVHGRHPSSLFHGAFDLLASESRGGSRRDCGCLSILEGVTLGGNGKGRWI